MDHSEAIELLGESLAGSPGGARAAGLREHLDSCEECRTWAADYRLFAEALTGETAAHPSSERLARQATDPGLLGPLEQVIVNEHLESCPECRRQVALTTSALSHSRPSPRSWRLFSGMRLAPKAYGLRLALAASLLLAAAVAFMFLDSRTTDIGRDRVLTSGDLGDSQVVVAAGSITAAALTLETGIDVVLRAGETVILGNGFAVDSGASLAIETARSGQPPPLPDGV